MPGLANPRRARAGYLAIPALVDGGRLGENAGALGQPRDAEVITERRFERPSGTYEKTRVGVGPSRLRAAEQDINQKILALGPPATAQIAATPDAIICALAFSGISNGSKVSQFKGQHRPKALD